MTGKELDTYIGEMMSARRVFEKGVIVGEIAQLTGIDGRNVYRWIKKNRIPKKHLSKLRTYFMDIDMSGVRDTPTINTPREIEPHALGNIGLTSGSLKSDIKHADLSKLGLDDLIHNKLVAAMEKAPDMLKGHPNREYLTGFTVPVEYEGERFYIELDAHITHHSVWRRRKPPITDDPSRENPTPEKE